MMCSVDVDEEAELSQNRLPAERNVPVTAGACPVPNSPSRDNAVGLGVPSLATSVDDRPQPRRLAPFYTNPVVHVEIPQLVGGK
jgi:hypothetical protein